MSVNTNSSNPSLMEGNLVAYGHEGVKSCASRSEERRLVDCAIKILSEVESGSNRELSLCRGVVKKMERFVAMEGHTPPGDLSEEGQKRLYDLGVALYRREAPAWRELARRVVEISHFFFVDYRKICSLVNKEFPSLYPQSKSDLVNLLADQEEVLCDRVVLSQLTISERVVFLDLAQTFCCDFVAVGAVAFDAFDEELLSKKEQEERYALFRQLLKVAGNCIFTLYERLPLYRLRDCDIRDLMESFPTYSSDYLYDFSVERVAGVVVRNYSHIGAEEMVENKLREVYSKIDRYHGEALILSLIEKAPFLPIAMGKTLLEEQTFFFSLLMKWISDFRIMSALVARLELLPFKAFSSERAVKLATALAENRANAERPVCIFGGVNTMHYVVRALKYMAIEEWKEEELSSLLARITKSIYKETYTALCEELLSSGLLSTSEKFRFSLFEILIDNLRWREMQAHYSKFRFVDFSYRLACFKLAYRDCCADRESLLERGEQFGFISDIAKCPTWEMKREKLLAMIELSEPLAAHLAYHGEGLHLEEGPYEEKLAIIARLIARGRDALCAVAKNGVGLGVKGLDPHDKIAIFEKMLSSGVEKVVESAVKSWFSLAMDELPPCAQHDLLRQALTVDSGNTTLYLIDEVERFGRERLSTLL